MYEFPDCNEENVNATDRSWMSTTESIESTTIPMAFDSIDDSDLDDYTLEPIDDDLGATDEIEFEPTTSSTTTTSKTADPPTAEPRSSRRKRHINFPGVNVGDNNAYTMEVMVAVDRKMQEYHGNNIQAYVLTLMSIVSNIYADASIGNSIDVAVVHIFLLKHDLHDNDNGRGGKYIAESLTKCSLFWQKKRKSIPIGRQTYRDD